MISQYHDPHCIDKGLLWKSEYSPETHVLYQTPRETDDQREGKPIEIQLIQRVHVRVINSDREQSVIIDD